MENRKDDITYYDTLRNDEVELLKSECLRVIRKESPNDGLDDVFDLLSNFFICCSCSCFWKGEAGINEDVVEVTELLKNKGYVKKLFYHDIEDEDAKAISDAMYMGVNHKYEDVDPYILAGGLKRYCKDHLPLLIPQDVHLLLLYAYRDNIQNRKKEILTRVPFVIGDYPRLFLMQMFKLFKEIDKEVKTSETSIDNLLDIFAPLLIKDPSQTNQFNGFTKKQILKDLMEVDFMLVPEEFFPRE